RRVREAQVAGRETRVFVHELGVHRDDGRLWSRNGESIFATPVRFPGEVYGADVLVVDEAHFWHEFEVKYLADLARHHDVSVAGLDTSFRGDPSPAMAYLLAMADSVSKLTAVCARCGGQ